MSLTVPFRATAAPQPDGASAGDPPVLRLGRLELGPALAYLLLWSAVLFVVELLVLWSGHEALDRLGVLASVSGAVATVLDLPVPDTGVLPALEFGALLPWLLLAAAAVTLLWLLTMLAVVLVHNAICAVTGGPRVRVRP